MTCSRLRPLRRCRGLALIAFGLSVTAACTAQPAAPPPVPAVPGYQSLGKRTAALGEAKHASVTVLGNTLGGREVHLVTVTAGEKTDAHAASKPAILIVGNVHAPHLAGGEMALRLAEVLVAKADDEKVKPLLDRFTFYIIPTPCPDAADAFFRVPHFEREGNSRDTDDDRDGAVNEDGPDDLNGDGEITMMRVADPTGEWMAHPDDSRVLIKADRVKGEKGQYRLYSEGRDNDQDEAFNEDGPGGVAFNRNFPFQYPFFKPGAGPHQVSEIETRAVADFAFAHPNIAVVLSFSPEDNLFHPWKPGQDGRIKTKILEDDAPLHEYLAKSYRDIHGGKDAPSPAKGEGGFSEWAYFHYGRWSFAARGWWVPRVEAGGSKGPGDQGTKGAEKDKPPVSADAEGAAAKAADAEPKKKPSDEKRGSDEINAHRWLAREKIDGFVEWKAVEHPDFPGRKVEVGGFKPYVLLNPPLPEVEALTDKHLKWLTEVCDRLPKLAISEVKVEPLGEPGAGSGVFRVKVTVMNEGYLPTMPQMGDVTKQPHPLQLKIDLPAGATLIQSQPRTQLDRIAGGGKAEHTWLVQAPKGGAATLKVWSPSVGAATRTVELK